MLGDKYKITVSYKDKKNNKINKDIFFNMQAIKNIYKLTGKSIFKWISEFKDENKKDCIVQSFIAMNNGNFDLNLLNDILRDSELVDSFYLKIKAIISCAMKVENDRTKDDRNSDELDIYSNDFFISWWNRMYFLATVCFKKSVKWFYNSTPAEIQTLNNIRIQENKNVLLGAYCDVMEAKNKAKEDNKKDEVVEIDEYTSFSSIFC